MRELCDRLEVDTELCSQIWTCFEHCLMQHTDLMKDRHLDQLIMCSVYVMAKVCIVAPHSNENLGTVFLRTVQNLSKVLSPVLQ